MWYFYKVDMANLLKLNSFIDGVISHKKLALRWISLNLTIDMSPIDQVMAL